MQKHTANHLNRSANLLALAGFAMIPGAVSGQDQSAAGEAAIEEASEVLIQRKLSDRLGRWRVNAKVGFNISASFSGLGSFPAQTAPGAAAGAGDRFYDDGFNRVDASGIPDGNTWFWAYSDASQLGVVGATPFVNMNSSTVLADGAISGVNSGVSPGLEINREWEMNRNEKSTWGFLGGIGYTRVETEDNTTVFATESRRTDSFDTTGAVIPVAPFTGTAAGPHPRIDNAPTTSVTALFANGATVGGTREVQANVVDFRLGPYWNTQLGESTRLELNGGFMGALVMSEFSVNESTTVLGMSPTLQPGVSATQVSNQSSSDSGFLAGAFVGANLQYELNPSTALLLGAQYQYLPEFDQSLGARRAVLEMDASVYVTAGLAFSF
ncbi:MAG: hypothetical protein ACPGVU_08360 [Limisphaerales bacterium]